MIAFAAIEWTWMDAITVAGFLLTLLGLGVMLWQIRKTQSAARAAEVAAETVLRESRFAYEKYSSNLAQRFLAESRIYVDGLAWAKAAMRLSDLLHELKQLMALDEKRWERFVQDTHTWTVVCNKLDSGRLKQLPTPKRWLDYCHSLETELTRTTSLFT